MKLLFLAVVFFSIQLIFAQEPTKISIQNDVEIQEISERKPIGDVDDLEHVLSKVPNDENAIYNTAGIDVKPDFPGGMQEFYNFIVKKYKTPNVKGLQGKVYVKFVVEKDGRVNDIKVLRDIGYGTGEEAIRVLKKCPRWIPGEQNGRKVRVLYSLPISINVE